MDLEKSQKIVKILGILDIIAAVLGIIGAIGMFGLTGVAAMGVADSGLDAESATIGLGSIMAVGILMLISSIVSLLEGIFAIRASRDASKVGPLWIFAIIAAIFSLISLIASIIQGQQIGSNIVSLVVNCFTFYLANNIKKYSNS
ncbi:MAG: hypothetical protein IJ705_01865 [Oscillospiraceae bacterium]|nr:hypothetical protein [Oscillospiraceae bacterium]